jgi:hypothetical protein
MTSADICLNFQPLGNKQGHFMIMTTSHVEAVMCAIHDAGLQVVLPSLKPHRLTAACALWAPSLLEVTGSSASLVPLASPVHLAPAVLRLVYGPSLHAQQAKLHDQPPFQSVNAAACQALAGLVTQQRAAAKSAQWAHMGLLK